MLDKLSVHSIGNDEGRERPAAVIQVSHFSPAHLHRDIRHNDMVEHVHSSGCNHHVRASFLERAGRVELSDQALPESFMSNCGPDSNGDISTLVRTAIEDYRVGQHTFGRRLLLPNDQRYETPLWLNTKLLEALATYAEAKSLR